MTLRARFKRALGGLLVCAVWPIAGAAAAGGGLTVSVADRNGNPVPDVAVYAVPDVPLPPRGGPPPHAVMDQRHRQFVPHILVVEAGTLVDFPNHDTVSHHVYSFSPAHPFELQLYRGDPHPPIEFDVPGTIVLGCNIHDNMIGYIQVVATPYFAKTDEAGRVELGALPAGGYTVHVWTPRLKEKELPAPVAVKLTADAEHTLSFRFENRLYPPFGQGASSLRWNQY